MVRLLIATAIIFLAGCASTQPDSSEIQLMVQPDTVMAGDSVTLVLDNASARPLGYNLCTSAFERRASDGWQPVPSNRACTMELRVLEPGQTASFTGMLPAAMRPGEYRAVTGIERMADNASVSIASEPFRVR